ncbi:MAG TPA: serine hydrolase domain-containing protein, partial [Thermoanaerobaculia bacterium]|nr:serine hydrolase domain-containing protein [Thermoanaerobaculia bacterium]
MRSGTLLITLMLGAACATTTPLRDTRFEPIRQKLQQTVAKDELNSISVAVAIDGRIVWEEAFGYADREKKILATPQTQYAAASITKPITATAIMKLVDEGKLELSQPVVGILGPISIRGGADDASRMTVRSILHHRAGLAEQNRYYFPGEVRPPLEEILRRYAIVAHPIEEKYRYSNIGYAVLEAVIERLSGQPYATFLRESIFTPLGMKRTSVGPATGAATLYDPDRKPIPPYDFAARGAGWVFSTAPDLVRFGLMHLGQPLADQKPVLRESTRAQMLEDRTSTGSATGRYGLDWYC